MNSRSKFDDDQHRQLLALFAAALNAADIKGKFDPVLPMVPAGRTVVVGAGKGAAAMARELDRVWPGELSGAVVTRHGFGLPDYAGRIDVIEAGHPVPDEASVAGAARLSSLVYDLGSDDLVIALISGGASALLAGLPDGVVLDDKKAVTKALLSCGATISEINTVRKHISTIKGGRLARLAAPAHVVTFAVSDIPGDDIAAIGSGPTVFDRTTPSDALAILKRYGITFPVSIERCLEVVLTETRAIGGEPARNEAHLVVKPADSLAAAAARAEASGYQVINLGDDLEGEASELGAAHARLALELQAKGERACLLSGGETTVTLKAKGRGGRNTEYLLALALGLAGQPGISALAADTDGIDGSENNAGALIFPSTIARAAALGQDPSASLATNNSYGFFAAIGDLLITGPTLTNVNDFRAILVEPLEGTAADNDHGGQA